MVCPTMTDMNGAAAASGETRFQPVFARRSLIVLVVLLLGETSINYIDRQVVSVLAPTLRAEFH